MKVVRRALQDLDKQCGVGDLFQRPFPIRLIVIHPIKVRAAYLELVVPKRGRREGDGIQYVPFPLHGKDQAPRNSPATEGILEIGINAQGVTFAHQTEAATARPLEG